MKVRVECPDCGWESGWVLVYSARETMIGVTVWVIRCPDCDGRECVTIEERWQCQK